MSAAARVPGAAPLGRPAREVAIVTPWYPTRNLPFRGAFVRAMVEAAAPGLDRATVYHCDCWSAPVSRREEDAVREAHRTLLPRALRMSTTVAGAGLLYVPVPMPGDITFSEIARHHEASLRAALAGGQIEAPVVHAHVGLPAGWAAMRNARATARLFVTEHATFLDRVLAEPSARAMYDQVLHRCTRFFAVGGGLRARLTEAFPRHAHKIDVAPNPIAFDNTRAAPVTELRRWLFVGGLVERKGVDWLLEAFAKCRVEEPALTLTLVGSGVLGGALKERAVELGVADAVSFTGPLPLDGALRLMREHDLLVHPSRLETFGVTVVEAVAAGLPVLVTRCGGPEETLAGIEEAVGELVDVEDGDAAIVAGYRRLCARFPRGLDLALARRVLADRYGYPAVARTYHRAWFPEPAAV
jgi:glycogen(starch) synthase